jgi:hypothetical protein
MQNLLRKTLCGLCESYRGHLDLQLSYSPLDALLFKILELFPFKLRLSKIKMGRPHSALRRRTATPRPRPRRSRPCAAARGRAPPEVVCRPRWCATLGYSPSPRRRRARDASALPHVTRLLVAAPYVRRAGGGPPVRPRSGRTRAGRGAP